ncbi:hypothetical protein T484DRAFT_1792119 [Baffinella frigidus]|nr:hypothetical protein T484DRAFT_1792119 [Cryptophyta sp. CCMP2293]
MLAVEQPVEAGASAPALAPLDGDQPATSAAAPPPILFPGEVPRISANDITPEEFEARYIKRGMPVVLTGAMDAWPAYMQGSSRKWTFDFFTKQYGDEPCTVDTYGTKEETTLGEYIAKLEGYGEAALAKKQVPYLRTWYFSDDIPELVDDFEPPRHFHTTDAFMRLPEMADDIPELVDDFDPPKHFHTTDAFMRLPESAVFKAGLPE